MNTFKMIMTGICFTGVSGAALAQTQSTTLGDLINSSGTISSGDKLFSDFTYLGTGDVPAADDINVVAITDNLGNFGLRFQGAFMDLPGNAGSDALITYKITVTDPDFAITGARMQGNPDVLGGGNSFAGVTDTFLPQVTDQNLAIFDNDDILQLDSSVFFDGAFTELDVQKDIILFTDDDSVATTLSFVDQTYYQVPEPTSLALLGIGSLLIARRRRDR